MRALVLAALVAIGSFGGCSHSDACPDHPFNDVPCSTEGQICAAATRGSCTCEGHSWYCPGDFPQVHDLAVPDLAPPRDLLPAND